MAGKGILQCLTSTFNKQKSGLKLTLDCVKCLAKRLARIDASADAWLIDICSRMFAKGLARVVAGLAALLAGINSQAHTQLATAWLAIALIYLVLKQVVVPALARWCLALTKKQVCLDEEQRLQRGLFLCARISLIALVLGAGFLTPLIGFPMFLSEFLWDLLILIMAWMAKALLPRTWQVLFMDLTYSPSYLDDDPDPCSSRGVSRKGSRKHRRGLLSIHPDLAFDMPDQALPQRLDLAISLPVNILLWSFAAHFRHPWVPSHAWWSSTLLLRLMLSHEPDSQMCMVMLSFLLLLPSWFGKWLPAYLLYLAYISFAPSALWATICVWSFAPWESMPRFMAYVVYSRYSHKIACADMFWGFFPGTWDLDIYCEAAAGANQFLFQLARRVACFVAGVSEQRKLPHFGWMVTCVILLVGSQQWGLWQLLFIGAVFKLSDWSGGKDFSWHHAVVALGTTCAAVWYAPLSPFNCLTCMMIVLMHEPSVPVATALNLQYIASSTHPAVGFPLVVAWAVGSRLWFMIKVVLKAMQAEREEVQYTAGVEAAAAVGMGSSPAAAAAAAVAKVTSKAKGRQGKQQQDARVFNKGVACTASAATNTSISSSSLQGADRAQQQQQGLRMRSKKQGSASVLASLGKLWGNSSKAEAGSVKEASAIAAVPCTAAAVTEADGQEAATVRSQKQTAQGVANSRQKGQHRVKQQHQQGKGNILPGEDAAACKGGSHGVYQRGRSGEEVLESSELVSKQALSRSSSGNSSSGNSSSISSSRRRSGEEGMAIVTRTNAAGSRKGSMDGSTTSSSSKSKKKQSSSKVQRKASALASAPATVLLQPQTLAAAAAAAKGTRMSPVVSPIAAAAALECASEVAAPSTPALTPTKLSSSASPSNTHSLEQSQSRPKCSSTHLGPLIVPSLPCPLPTAAAAPAAATSAAAFPGSFPAVAARPGAGQSRDILAPSPALPTAAEAGGPSIATSSTTTTSNNNSSSSSSDDAEGASSEQFSSSNDPPGVVTSPVHMWSFLDDLQAKAQAHQLKVGQQPLGPVTTALPPPSLSAAPWQAAASLFSQLGDDGKVAAGGAVVVARVNGSEGERRSGAEAAAASTTQLADLNVAAGGAVVVDGAEGNEGRRRPGVHAAATSTTQLADLNVAAGGAVIVGGAEGNEGERRSGVEAAAALKIQVLDKTNAITGTVAVAKAAVVVDGTEGSRRLVVDRNDGSRRCGMGKLGGACVVCGDGECCVLLLPCKHLVLCKGCSEGMKGRGAACPKCDGQVDRHVLVRSI